MHGREVAELVLEQLKSDRKATPAIRGLYADLDEDSQKWLSSELPGDVEFFGGEKLMACRLEKRIRQIVNDALKERKSR